MKAQGKASSVLREYEAGVVDQINSMINPDPTNAGKFSIHDPTPEPFMTKRFKETDCQVTSLSVPANFDAFALTINVKQP